MKRCVSMPKSHYSGFELTYLSELYSFSAMFCVPHASVNLSTTYILSFSVNASTNLVIKILISSCSTSVLVCSATYLMSVLDSIFFLSLSLRSFTILLLI